MVAALGTAPALLTYHSRLNATKCPKRLFMGSLRSDVRSMSKTGKPPARICARVRSSSNGGSIDISQESGETTKASYIWPNRQKPRICILGGGFGGLYTALRLESLVWTDDKKPQVLLVDKSDRFVFKPMLYELLSGEVEPWEIAPTFSDLLRNTGVQFVKDRVKHIQPSDQFGSNGSGKLSCGGSVHLESGSIVEYDWLVLALGSEVKLDTVPGAAEFALAFSTLDDAQKVNNVLQALERSRFGKMSSPISVAIVGCGYCGVELAATVSERLKDKGIVQAVNVDTNICSTAPLGNRETALRVLSSRNIQLFLGYFVSCVKKSSRTDGADGVLADEISTDTSETHQKFILDLQPAQRGLASKTIEADLVLWTVGSKPLIPQPETYSYGGLIPLNSRGQAEIDETLRVKGHNRIFAIGDSAALRDSAGRLLPATAQVAFQQADFTGWNLWAAINGRPLLPFRFQNLGEMMTLGTNEAAITPGFIEGLTLDGPVGHAARKIVYLWRMPTDDHRVKVGISWLTKSALHSLASLQGSLSKTFWSS